MIGRKYGRLTVLEFDKKTQKCFCECECGNRIWVYRTNIQRKSKPNTQSCGCLWKEQNAKSKYIKDADHARIYRIWSNIKSRCNNKNSTQYQWYGAKCIKVCKEWQQFEPFNAWARTTGYKKNLTIDRIDSCKGYEPSNCRWVSQSEQNINRTSNIYVNYNGTNIKLFLICKKKGISPRLAYNRIKKLKWTAEKAIDTPKITRAK